MAQISLLGIQYIDFYEFSISYPFPCILTEQDFRGKTKNQTMASRKNKEKTKTKTKKYHGIITK